MQPQWDNHFLSNVHLSYQQPLAQSTDWPYSANNRSASHPPLAQSTDWPYSANNQQYSAGQIHAHLSYQQPLAQSINWPYSTNSGSAGHPSLAQSTDWPYSANNGSAGHPHPSDNGSIGRFSSGHNDNTFPLDGNHYDFQNRTQMYYDYRPHNSNQECHNPMPQTSNWQNQNEGYRQYDYTQQHSYLNHGERRPSQESICYDNPAEPCFDGRSRNCLYPTGNFAWQNMFEDHPKEYTPLMNRQPIESLHHCSQNEQSHSQSLLMQIPLNENQMSTDNSFSTISVPDSRPTMTSRASSESEVQKGQSAALPDTILPVTIKPKGELGCDNRDMYMETSDQSAKKLCCPFSQKLVIKLARHMEVMHTDEADVKRFLTFPKGSKKRRTIQDSLRKIGQTSFNKNAALNNKQLIPSRRPNPKHKRKVTDERTCPYCFGSYAKSGIHFHIKNKCLHKPIRDERTEGERIISALTSSVERRYHEHANPALQTVFDGCHNDDIVRGVRFDWLAVVYGNKLTSKYNKPRHRKMIKNRMRLIGRVLSALKKIVPEVNELAKFLVSKYYDRVVEAIRTVARVDEVRGEFVAPATASSAVTAIRQICEMLVVEYIKQDDQEMQRVTRNFLTIMNSDMHISINKMVNETQSRMARQRNVILPSSEDVKRLVNYLESERSACFNELSQCYDFKNWVRLAELTMVSIIVFNRRRVGDTQNILDEDFACKEMISQKTNEELMSVLPENSKDIASQFSRMKVRGKKNRTVPVLLKSNVAECLELLISHRKEAGVSPLNEFLFGLPSKKDVYQVVDAGKVLRKFAKGSGATNPSLLTATNLRKHLATICVTLQLNDTAVADVAEFMGHREPVHREHYRQNPIERQIVQMSQVLEAAQGNFTVTNQDKTPCEQGVNKGRKRKLQSTDALQFAFYKS